ncbi:MAG: ATP-binding protein [Bacteroidales bacterium]|nr:ATP-binding protein [Bacteroidales bacterium]
MATTKTMDLLSAMEQIVDKAKGSGLSSDFFRKANTYIKYVSEKLELTKEQSVLMALFIDNCSNRKIDLSNICKYLGCRNTQLLRYMADVDELEKRELIRCRHNEVNTYSVPKEVIDAFKNNQKYRIKDCSELSCRQLFCELNSLFDLRKEKMLTYETLVIRIHRLFDCNRHLLYVQKVKSYAFMESDEMMLILFSHLFVNNNDDNIGFHDLEFLYDEHFQWSVAKYGLGDGVHSLMEAGIIEYNNVDGMADRESFRMTFSAKRELFAELNLASAYQRQMRGDVVKVENITPKKLFYGEKVGAQIAELTSLLNDAQYKQICARMKEAGFRSGFTCLFYGEPGTGKTESVLQLARQTGRNILQVNISQIRSMWVGESEKNIKQVFDTYRAQVDECETTPILLFNEADAVISTRKEGVNDAVNKMENTIQNIILQEMETLDGILIATTNLAQNMDGAFERRFLYKIKFEKPTTEARVNMWREMIPTLDSDTATRLANKYDFCGGQIENIARHYTIGNILHGEPQNIVAKLSEYCDGERLESRETSRIGFGK